MSLFIKLLPDRLPACLRKRILLQLFTATADAFQCPLPPLDQRSYAELLRAYALFTRGQAQAGLWSEAGSAVIKNRLYQNAVPLGRKMRTWTGVRTMQEVMRLAQILYRAIGVDMQGDALGNLTVNRCYYSQFYSAAVCDLISALDDGIFSGLSAGYRLRFSVRLTQGCACCKARLQ